MSPYRDQRDADRAIPFDFHLVLDTPLAVGDTVLDGKVLLTPRYRKSQGNPEEPPAPAPAPAPAPEPTPSVPRMPFLNPPGDP